MTPFDFLTMIWPDAGLYCLATPAANGYTHKVVGTVDDAADWVATHADTKNIFFNVHALREAKVWNPRKKNHDGTEGGYSVRLQANMRAAKAFFFDLDVGTKPGQFADQREALTDLQNFCRATGLPQPTMVSSGGGIHVYWVLDEELPSSPEWQLRAQKLKQLAQHYEFKVDPARTTDTSSVLRVPGSFNLKDGGKRPVQVYHRAPPMTLDNFDAIVNGAMVGCNLAPRQVAMQASAASASPFGSNTQREFEGRKLTAMEVFQTCGQMARLARLRGQCSEPEWYAGLSVIVELQNADKLIHTFSDADPRYNAADTIAKAARAKIGPASCQKLYDVSTDKAACNGCPFFDGGNFKTKGPLAAARIEEESAPEPVVETLIDGAIVVEEIPNPPKPYKRGKNGGIVQIMEDEEGKQYTKTIHAFDLYPLARDRNNFAKTEDQTWRYHPPMGGHYDFTINAREFVGKELQGVLADHGVYAGSVSDFSGLKNYMSAYIQELVRNKPLGTQQNHLGWVDGKQGFVLGDKILRSDGTTTPVTFGVNAREAPRWVEHTGTLKDQIAFMRFFSRRGLEAQQFQILLSLGSALVSMSGHHGMVIHATGETGGLKTTTMLACAAVWGHPDRNHLNGMKNGATQNARATRMEVLSNLPLCLDEMTNLEAVDIRDFALASTQARGRERLDHKGNPRPVLDNERSSFILTNANKSFYTEIAFDPQAARPTAMRIFEIDFEKQPDAVTIQCAGVLAGLTANHGHIGEAFMRYVVTHHTDVVNMLTTIRGKLAHMWVGHGDERYYKMALETAMLTCHIARSLKLLDFDAQRIYDWFKGQLAKNRGTVSADRDRHVPVAVMADFINAVQGDTLITNRDNKGDPYPINTPRGELMGHLDLATQRLVFSRQSFFAYCQRRGTPQIKILRALAADGIVVEENAKRMLGQGTTFGRVRTNCFVLDLTHIALAGIATPTAPPQPVSNVVPLKKPGTP